MGGDAPGGWGGIAPNPTFVGRGRPVVVLEVGTYEVHSIVIVRRRSVRDQTE